MSLGQRIARLEHVEEERELLRGAEWLAERYSLSLDEVLRSLRETSDRIDRWGLDAEVRRLAREWGKSEDEVRAELEAHTAEWEAWKADAAQFGPEDADQGRGG